MKNKIMIMIAVTTLLSLAACGEEGTGNRTGNGTQTVSDVLEAGVEAGNKGSVGTPEATSTPTAVPTAAEDPGYVTEPAEGVDVDLTAMSSTLVYSEVYNMMYTPEEYVGKKVRMEGFYSIYHDEASGVDYYACIIQDATACCAQGLEFVPLNPEKCPEEGEIVKVEGTFTTYIEGDQTYCTLRNATVL